jgi:hypothetical protein
MKRIAPGVIAALAIVATATPALAWDVIGQRQVRDRTERDTIVLGGPRTFSRIKLCVYRNPVQFKDLDVRFANGGHQDVGVRERINPGGCTRNIDLEGGARNIESISMLYEETSWGRRKSATVRVFAE